LKAETLYMETLDKHFRKLTEPVFKKHGFARSDVTAHWPEIVGEQTAAISTPERIRWPRGMEDKASGTLFLKVQAGRGLDVEYAAAGILERVNRFLGYQAVSSLKVMQVHNFRKVVRIKSTPPEATAVVLAQVATIKDTDLQMALARLGAGVAASHPRSPQAK
jgi:hypothetical protein